LSPYNNLKCLRPLPASHPASEIRVGFFIQQAQTTTFLAFHHHHRLHYYDFASPDDIETALFYLIMFSDFSTLAFLTDAVQGGSGSSKLHHCSYPACERTYGKSSHLKAHMRTHTGNTLFSFFLFESQKNG
jgi:hypothetical protein